MGRLYTFKGDEGMGMGRGSSATLSAGEDEGVEMVIISSSQTLPLSSPSLGGGEVLGDITAKTEMVGNIYNNNNATSTTTTAAVSLNDEKGAVAVDSATSGYLNKPNDGHHLLHLLGDDIPKKRGRDDGDVDGSPGRKMRMLVDTPVSASSTISVDSTSSTASTSATVSASFGELIEKEKEKEEGDGIADSTVSEEKTVKEVRKKSLVVPRYLLALF